MESRFSKYENSSMAISNQIANINNYIDWNYKSGLDLIEKEINALQELIGRGEENKMFPKKINELITLGKSIEKLYDTYHFNRGSKEAVA